MQTASTRSHKSWLCHKDGPGYQIYHVWCSWQEIKKYTMHIRIGHILNLQASTSHSARGQKQEPVGTKHLPRGPALPPQYTPSRLDSQPPSGNGCYQYPHSTRLGDWVLAEPGPKARLSDSRSMSGTHPPPLAPVPWKCKGDVLQWQGTHFKWLY